MRRTFLKAGGAGALSALLAACGGGGSSSSSSNGGSGPTSAQGGSQTPQTPPAPQTPPTSGTPDLLGAIQSDSRMALLARVVDKAQAASLLTEASDRTLFAPGDDAFEALAQRIGFATANAMLDALSAGQWLDILRFHIVPQRLTLAQIEASAGQLAQRPMTLLDTPIGVARLIFERGSGGVVNIWDGVGRSTITLVEGDGEASNGLLHVVSDVMLPRFVLDAAQMVRANIDTYRGFAQALVNDAALLSTLSGDATVTLFVPVDGSYAAPLSGAQLRNHVLGQYLPGSSFTDSSLTMMSGNRVTMRRGPPATLAYAAATVTVSDTDFFTASNGVIHTLRGALI